MENLDATPSITEDAQSTETQNQVEQTTPEVNVQGETPEAKPEEKSEDGMPKGIKKRIGKLTREKYELRQELDALREQVAKMQPKAPEKTAEDFANEAEFQRYQVKQEVKAELAEQQESQRQLEAEKEAQNQRATSWQEKINSVKDSLPDYQEVVSENMPPITETEQAMILDSDFGPQIAYELSTNESLALKFQNLRTKEARDRFLLKLDIQMENRAQTKPVSQAPKPVPQKTSGTPPQQLDPSKMDMDTFTKWRNGEL